MTNSKVLAVAALALLVAAVARWIWTAPGEGPAAAAGTQGATDPSDQSREAEAVVVHPAAAPDREPVDSAVTSEPVETTGVAESILINGIAHSVEWDGDLRSVRRPSGSLLSVGPFGPDGREGSHKAFHENGAPWIVDEWVGGKRHGPSTYYFDDGQVASSGSYSRGFRDGHWTTWYPSGSLRSEGIYESDGESQQRVGAWIFLDPNGEVNESESGVYEGGKRVGGLTGN